MKKIFFIFSLISAFAACGRVNNVGIVDEAELLFPEDYVPNPVVLPYGETVFCPDGWTASDAQLCVQGSQALGPFTQAMRKRCLQEFNASFCEQDVWPLEVATALRGNETCMMGSELSGGGDCVEEAFQYGPFRKEFVEKCKRNNEQLNCESMRWSAASFQLDGKNSDLENYYSGFENYLKVWDDVTDWFAPINHGSTTSNGCVAFLSTAMRHVGVNIPIQGSINGKGISINTEGFEAFVRDRLKWQVIKDAAELLPGDAVISKDRKNHPGHPDHVYMFHGWQDKTHSIGWVIDNQANPNNRQDTYIHRRNIVDDQLKIKKTPYARHYRAPESAVLVNR